MHSNPRIPTEPCTVQFRAMTGPKDEEIGDRTLRGRRGGRTTVTRVMVRKTFWIDRDVEERLREDAFHSGRTEAELVREALRRYYDIED